MILRYFAYILLFNFSSTLGFGKTIYTEIPQPCKNIQWNVNSTESESSFLVSSAIYQSLVRLGPRGSILPNLAESWKVITPTQIQFTLRDKVFFSNGVQIEAQDAKASLEQIMLKTAFTKIILGGLKNIEVLDQKNFYLNLLKPDPLIFQKLSVFFRLYFLRDQVDLANGDKMVPGTGPWKFESKSTDQYTFKSLSNNGNENLIIFCNSHGNTVDRLGKSNKNDLILIDGLSYKDQLTMRKRFKLNTIETSDSVQSFGIFNLLSDNKAIKDIEIRKAVNYALDRPAFSRLVLKEQGHMLPGLSLSNEIGHNELNIYPYKKSEAKAIVSKWKKANKQNKIILRVGLQSDEDTTISFVEQLKYSLKQVGIDLVINRQYAVEKQKEFQKEIDLIFGSDPSPYLHIDFLIRNFYISTSMFFVGATNELEAAIAATDALSTGEDSESHYKIIDKYLYDNFLGVPGFQPQKIRAYSGNIQEISSQGPLLDFSAIPIGGI
jgi:peptide/nickel transport system substrate-binding protein